MKSKSVVVTKRGSPEALKVIKNDLNTPSTGEVRIKILASSVFLPDVEAQYGRTSFGPKTPYVPGYAIIGDVEMRSENASPALLWGLGDGIDRLCGNA